MDIFKSSEKYRLFLFYSGEFEGYFGELEGVLGFFDGLVVFAPTHPSPESAAALIILD